MAADAPAAPIPTMTTSAASSKRATSDKAMVAVLMQHFPRISSAPSLAGAVDVTECYSTGARQGAPAIETEEMSMMPGGVHFNHLGQTITDIAKARRFYEGLLGFKFWWDFQVPDELSSRVLMVPPPCRLTATYLWRPDLVLNLMHFGDPNAAEAFQKRRLNSPGLTHLALSVEDVPGLLAKVPEYGGQVLPESQGPDSDWGRAIYIRDPDGQLIEIVTMAWREKLPPPPV
jgi:catechol 2,3-dioxygenase-like lactoylglutathione lyase family enzyme